jgi:hypothetical protein
MAVDHLEEQLRTGMILSARSQDSTYTQKNVDLVHLYMPWRKKDCHVYREKMNYAQQMLLICSAY